MKYVPRETDTTILLDECPSPRQDPNMSTRCWQGGCLGGRASSTCCSTTSRPGWLLASTCWQNQLILSCLPENASSTILYHSTLQNRILFSVQRQSLKTDDISVLPADAVRGGGAAPVGVAVAAHHLAARAPHLPPTAVLLGATARLLGVRRAAAVPHPVVVLQASNF